MKMWQEDILPVILCRLYPPSWQANSILNYFHLAKSTIQEHLTGFLGPVFPGLIESLRCKTSTPTWTSKLKHLYFFLQRTENFRFWWVRGILSKLKNYTYQIWNEFSWKILEPVWENITLPSFVLPFSFHLKTYAFHVVKDGRRHQKCTRPIIRIKGLSNYIFCITAQLWFQ